MSYEFRIQRTHVVLFVVIIVAYVLRGAIHPRKILFYRSRCNMKWKYVCYKKSDIIKKTPINNVYARQIMRRRIFSLREFHMRESVKVCRRFRFSGEIQNVNIA